MKIIGRIAGPLETTMKVLTLEPVNTYPPGVVIEVTEREGKQLIEKGLVKAAPVPQNKMAAEGANKDNPSPAAGSAPTSSASPAAPRSPRKTATRSAAGAPKKSTGRPRKAPAGE